jgi:hypothetical protein
MLRANSSSFLARKSLFASRFEFKCEGANDEECLKNLNQTTIRSRQAIETSISKQRTGKTSQGSERQLRIRPILEGADCPRHGNRCLLRITGK